MTAITKSTLYSQGYTLIKNFLNANVTDPVEDTTDSSRTWIYSDMPDFTKRNKDRDLARIYPFFVIGELGVDTEGKSFGTPSLTENHKKERSHKFLITLYTLKSAAQVRTISDEVIAAFDADTSLADNGLNNIEVADSSSDEIDLEGHRVLTKVFGVMATSVLDYT